MLKKSIIISVLVSLVLALGVNLVMPKGSSTLGGTVEIVPVLFQNGLQTGVNPLKTATDSLIRIGNRIASGNSSGTFIGLNAASGYAGDLMNLQVNGTSEFKIDASGNVTQNGSESVSGQLVGSGGVDTSSAIALNIAPTVATSVVVGGASTAATAISLVPTNAGTITLGSTTETGLITIGKYTGSAASSLSIAGGATTGAQTIHFADAATGIGSSIITIGSNVTTAGNGIREQGVRAWFHPTTAVSVSSSTTITASQLLNAAIILHPSTDNNARTFTLDTGGNIAAAMPGGTATAGDTFAFEIANGVNTVTLAADASSSFFTGATLTVAAGATRVINCQFTSGTVYICY